VDDVRRASHFNGSLSKHIRTAMRGADDSWLRGTLCILSVKLKGVVQINEEEMKCVIRISNLV
jgi:hypothetical protein